MRSNYLFLVFLRTLPDELSWSGVNLRVPGGEDDHVSDQDNHAGTEHGDDDGENDVELPVLLVIVVYKIFCGKTLIIFALLP